MSTWQDEKNSIVSKFYNSKAVPVFTLYVFGTQYSLVGQISTTYGLSGETKENKGCLNNLFHPDLVDFFV